MVVTGRIGSGKTTLLRSVLGLLPADAGEVAWNGDLIDDPAQFMKPPRTAYTPQVPRLFSLTLDENLKLGIEASDADIAEAIHTATMESDIASMPDGLETMVGPRGVRLSGGQVQRSAAARMLVRRPELLVFDDLSSARDGIGRLTPEACAAARRPGRRHAGWRHRGAGIGGRVTRVERRVPSSVERGRRRIGSGPGRRRGLYAPSRSRASLRCTPR